MERYTNIRFIMKPKVDFCFKELMEDAEVRKGFIAAVLHIPAGGGGGDHAAADTSENQI